MPSWLLIIIVGVVLLILGVAVEAAKFLIWIGIAVLVIGLIMSLMRRRGGSRV
jgi:membrane-bound ClpP family serine protease